MWIATAQCDILEDTELASTFHGTLSFSLQRKATPGFKDFLRTIKSDEAVRHYHCLLFEFSYKCFFPQKDNPLLKECMKEKIMDIGLRQSDVEMSGQCYSIYNAIYAMAHALQEAHMSSKRKQINKGKNLYIKPWQIFITTAILNGGAAAH